MYIAMTKVGAKQFIVATGVTSEQLVETLVHAGLVQVEENHPAEDLNLGPQYEGVLRACGEALRAGNSEGFACGPAMRGYLVFCV